MNSMAQSIIAVIILSIIGAIVNSLYGINGKAVFAALIVLSAIAVSVIYALQKKRLQKILQSMTPDQLVKYRFECEKAGADDPCEIISTSEFTLTGEIVDLLVGITAVFLPLFLYHIIMGLPIARDSEFTGWHLLWAVIGTSIYILFRKKILKPFMTRTEHVPPEGRGAAPRP